MLTNMPLLVDGMGINSKNIIWLGIEMTCPDMHREVMHANPHSSWGTGGGGGQFRKIIFTTN